MNSKKENITILIANYNNGKFVEECIQSVINQTSDRWDICIVDDASTDDSEKIYFKYKGNPRIKIISNKQNIGYIRTLKKLIKNSQNDIMGILDADDKLELTAIEKILNYYDTHCKAGCVYTNFWFCDEEMNVTDLGFSKPINPWQNSIECNYVSAFRTFRKSVYNLTEGYNESILYAEDKDIIYKLEEVTKLRIINEPLYFYRVLDNSESHGNAVTSVKSFKRARELAYKRRGLPNLDNKLFRRLYLGSLKKRRKSFIRNRTIDQDFGIENLVNAKEILDKLNMRNWLTDGTLLGYYRDSNFIKHDLDLDMGSFISEYNDNVILEFIQNGWKLMHVFGRKDLGLELSFIRNNLKLDIFFFYEEHGKYWHAAWDGTERGLNLIKYYYDAIELKEETFLNHKFMVPKETLKYITTKYGESWNKPIKNWDWADGPSNSVRTSIYL